jgi:hypothetical protein
MILHNPFDLEPEYPVVEASLHNSVGLWLLESFDQPVHLIITSFKDVFADGSYFFLGVVLVTHKIFQISDGAVGFEYLLCDWASLILFLS